LQVLNVQHDEDRSYVSCDDGTLIEATTVLDATGFARRLVQYDKPFNPGYQIAYGIVAEVCLQTPTSSLLLLFVATCNHFYLRSFESIRIASVKLLLSQFLQVDGHPFDLDKMLFMDWRDSHLRSDKALMEGNSKLPTFLYAMPFSANRIFLGPSSPSPTSFPHPLS
jgi:lycopene beta-cyclase